MPYFSNFPRSSEYVSLKVMFPLPQMVQCTRYLGAALDTTNVFESGVSKFTSIALLLADQEKIDSFWENDKIADRTLMQGWFP